LQPANSVLRAVGRVVVVLLRMAVVTGVGFLQMPPQMNEQRDGNAHNDQRTETQDQKPPDHPHSRLA